MILGVYDFDQFWNLFKKFIEFHRSSGVYSPEVLSLLKMDEKFVKKDLIKLMEKAKDSEEVLAIFEWKDEKMIAFAVATIEDYWAGGKQVNIDMIYVEERYRGRGVGTKMIENILRWAKEKDVRVASIHVAVRNDSVLKWLHKFGFIPFNIELRKKLEEIA